MPRKTKTTKAKATKAKTAKAKRATSRRKEETIFISLASYRDKELVPTIEDIISQASQPKNLRFGICWQRGEEENLDQYINDPRFIIIDVPYKEAKGVCWARNLIQKQFNNETYILQLDSHHRFKKGWDTILKNKLKLLKKKGTKKPIISTYIPSYEPDREPKGRCQDVWNLSFDRFMPEGAVFLRPNGMPEEWVSKKKKTMPRGRFLSGHFIFTDGHFYKNVPYDPHLYFHGEETSYAVRAYTHGYDIFQMDEIVAWHFYHRDGNIRHWDEHSDWDDINKNSFKRFKKLFNVDGEGDDKVMWGPYGLGKERTLQEFERFAGIDFENRRVHKETKLFLEPPVSNYEEGLTSEFKYCIDLHQNDVPEKDCDWMAVAFENEDGEEVARIDADESEVISLLREASQGDGWLRIWRTIEVSEVPKSWVVWPHSKTKGFLERIQRDLPKV